MSDEQNKSVSNESTTPKPTRPECHPENLPEALKAAGKFCNWKYIWKNDRWNKTPINPRIGRAISTKDPASFIDYQSVESMIDRYDGIGILIYGNVCGIDIDNCRDDAGNLTKSAQTIIDEMDSYTELSPSKTGVHIFFTVTDDIFNYIPRDPDEYKEKYFINNAKGDKTGQHEEVYIPGTTTGRYLTITGDIMEPRRDLEDRTEQVVAVINKYMKKAEPKPIQESNPQSVFMMSDNEILDALHRDKNWDSDFAALWDGDASAYDNDISRADQALLQKLAFYSGGRPDVIERLFSQSTLAEVSRTHNKWFRRSYMNNSIKNAIEYCGGNYYDPEYYRTHDGPGLTDEEREGFKKMRDRAQTSTQNNKTPSDAVDAPNSDETPEGEQVQADDEKGAEIAADGVGNGFRSFYTHSVGEYLSGGQFEKDIDYFRKYKDRKTGYKVIDHYMTMYPGLAVLGGSSSLGKTTFAVNLCSNLIQQGETVLYFSLEQEPIEIITKILARRLAEEYPDTPLTNIDIKNGATSEDLETVKKECAEEIGDHFQIIRCDFTVTAAKICGIIKDYMTEHPDRRPVVVVDYLQLTAPPDDFRGDVRAAVDQNIKTFKACQRDNELFMILISSFNRANYETPASFEDFKESGLIEFTADYVWELQLSIMSTSDFYSTTGAKGGTRETTKKEKSDAVASQLKKKQRPVEFVSLKSRNGAQRYEAYFNYDVEHDLFTPDPGVLYAKDPDKASRIFADLYADTEPDPRLIKAYQEQAEPIDWTGVNPEYGIPFN